MAEVGENDGCNVGELVNISEGEGVGEFVVTNGLAVDLIEGNAVGLYVDVGWNVGGE